MNRPKKSFAVLLAAASVGTALFGACAQPAAAADARPTAIVSMGDSYISGEGGRWQGNSTTFAGDRAGTDRAYVSFLNYDPAAIYGDTYRSGCDRADSAQILMNPIRVDRKINISCSTARTVNIFRSVSGGEALKGEPPQGDQLARLAAQNDVKMILLSTGGNDLGFGEALGVCAAEFVATPGVAPLKCNQGQQEALGKRIPTAMELVGRAIDDIHATMREAGYQSSSYKIIVQGPVSVIPSGDRFRYPETGLSRITTGGCPFWNDDATWIHDQAVPQVAEAFKETAAAHGASFLDLRNAFDGREICATDSRQEDGSTPPDPKVSEWGRFLNAGVSQGIFQESFHPNYYGQQAIGTCVGLAYASGEQSVNCRNKPGGGWRDMYLD